MLKLRWRISLVTGRLFRSAAMEVSNTLGRFWSFMLKSWVFVLIFRKFYLILTFPVKSDWFHFYIQFNLSHLKNIYFKIQKYKERHGHDWRKPPPGTNTPLQRWQWSHATKGQKLGNYFYLWTLSYTAASTEAISWLDFG